MAQTNFFRKIKIADECTPYLTKFNLSHLKNIFEDGAAGGHFPFLSVDSNTFETAAIRESEGEALKRSGVFCSPNDRKALLEAISKERLFVKKKALETRFGAMSEVEIRNEIVSLKREIMQFEEMRRK